jgi:hypothetical protein
MNALSVQIRLPSQLFTPQGVCQQDAGVPLFAK